MRLTSSGVDHDGLRAARRVEQARARSARIAVSVCASQSRPFVLCMIQQPVSSSSVR